MYMPRNIMSDEAWTDSDGIKIYTISIDTKPIEWKSFEDRLSVEKKNSSVKWSETPAFVIFHKGATSNYLVLCWWGNDNELFTSVSVQIDNQWISDSKQFSFCLYDMEVMWNERNIYIQTIDCETPSLENYRVTR